MKWDVAIAGGGVIGAAIAYELSKRASLGVTVVDDPTTFGAATRAAGGLLVLGGIDARPGFWFSVRRRSAALFEEWIDELVGQSEWDVGFRRGRVFHLVWTHRDAARWRAALAERAEHAGEGRWVDARELREQEPALAAGAVGAAWFAADAMVDPPALLRALRSAAIRRGVNWHLDRVRELMRERRSIRILCRSGDEIEAEQVVVAAGVWSRALLESLGFRLPVMAVRGEMIRLWCSRQGEPAAFATADGVIQFRSDEMWVAGNKQKTHAPAHVSVSGVTALLQFVGQTCAEGVVGDVLRVRAGLRPCSTIRHPLVGRPEGAERVLVATGHHRSGILLAPLTATLVRQVIFQEQPMVPLAAFAW